jgi:hypothetical protein
MFQAKGGIMKLILVLVMAITPWCGASAGTSLDFLYESVLVALKRQCSNSYPDMKPSIDQAVREYVTTNADQLSPDYLKRIEAKPSDGRAYTRKQCIGMLQLPKEPMKYLIRRAAKEREEDMQERGEYERSQK